MYHPHATNEGCRHRQSLTERREGTTRWLLESKGRVFRGGAGERSERELWLAQPREEWEEPSTTLQAMRAQRQTPWERNTCERQQNITVPLYSH